MPPYKICTVPIFHCLINCQCEHATCLRTHMHCFWPDKLDLALYNMPHILILKHTYVHCKLVFVYQWPKPFTQHTVRNSPIRVSSESQFRTATSTYVHASKAVKLQMHRIKVCHCTRVSELYNNQPSSPNATFNPTPQSQASHYTSSTLRTLNYVHDTGVE